MALWFGTEDAPAPSPTVQPGGAVPITVAVAPVDASNRVSVLYRVNGGPVQTLAASWLRTDPLGTAQHFAANLGSFRAGDAVEYTAQGVCAGRQVPAAEDLWRASMSFRVGDALSPLGVAPPPSTTLTSRTFSTESQVSRSQPSVRVAPAPASTGGPSEFEQNMARVQRVDGASLSQLLDRQQQDVNFLAQESRLRIDALVQLALAHRLASAYQLPAEVFYAFLRKRVPTGAPEIASPGAIEAVDGIVGRLASAIFALPAELQRRVLTDALAENLIPAALGDGVDDMVGLLQLHRITDSLDQPFMAGKTSLRSLLAVAQLPESKHAAVATALLQGGTRGELWRRLEADPRFASNEVAAVRRTLEIGGLVKNQVPMVSAVAQGFLDGTYHDLHDLARLSLEDWKQVIRRSAQNGQPGFPSNIDGATEEDRIATYAKEIKNRVGTAYPTDALLADVQAANVLPADVTPHVTRFFDHNPRLDLRRVNLESLVTANNGQALGSIDPAFRAAVVQQASRMQRVLRLVPHPDSATTLLKLNIDSAAQIYAMGKTQFVNTIAAAGQSRIEARKTFYRAEQRYGMLLSHLVQYNAQFNQQGVAVVTETAPSQAQQQAIDARPTLKSLFGSQDFCNCASCESVYGAAAYLVDILLWLGARKQSGPFPDAQAALFARRPDLQRIVLNCQNTNTQLPYTDLVCEILEDAIAPPATPSAHQTTLTEAELRAIPEYVNGQAYNTKIVTASFPHTLPQNTWLHEQRVYLGQMAVTRGQLVDAFRNLADPSTQPTALDAAAEFFGMTQAEAQLICNANAVPLSDAWNLADPVTTLSNVSAFVDHANIGYEDLRTLCQVQFVRAGGPATEITNITDACDTSTEGLSNLSAGRLDLIHRFLRLWRRTGYPMWELDLSLGSSAVGNSMLDASAITRMRSFRELQTRLHLQTDELLSFYGPIDIASHRDGNGDSTTSLYSRLFLDPAVTNPPDPSFAVSAVTATTTTTQITDKVPQVMAALRLTESEVTLLAANTDGTLTLDNLSALYRVTALARGLGLSVSDLFRFLQLAGENVPFASLDRTRGVVERWREISQWGFDLDHLEDLLTTVASAGLTDDDIAGYLRLLRVDEQKIHDDYASSSVPPIDLVTRRLPVIPAFTDAGRLVTAVQIVTGSFTGTLAQRNAFIDAYFADFMDPAIAKTQLGDLQSDPTDAQARQLEIQQRCELVLSGLARYATKTRVKELLVQTVKLAPDLCALLLNRLQARGTNAPLLEVLSDASLIVRTAGADTYAHDVTPADFPLMFQAIRQIHKVGALSNRLSLIADVVGWLIDHAADVGALNPGQLPIVAGDTPQTVDALLNTVRLVARARTFTANPTSSLYALLAAIIAGDSLANTQQSVASVTGWKLEDVQALHPALGLQYPADYRSPSTYARLARCMELVASTGVSAARLASWASTEPTSGDADLVRRAAKAKYSDDAWLQIAPSLEDPIREARRKSLVDYLVAHPNGNGWTNSDDLFAHFLIDVEMAPCMLTSRIVQAIAAVQLFVQRCLMNLETGVVADPDVDDGWKQWGWIQRYQLWVANRKVFLYPENWLSEFQRPNKSPFFAELEDELNRHEVNDDNVEAAFIHYLQKLDDTAHLEVCGVYDDREHSVQHVVARTKSSPPRYFHRLFQEGAWSPWGAIDADIKTTQVLPIMFRRRLHLFWPVLHTRPEQDQQVPAAQQSGARAADKPASYLELQLGWTVWRDGKWAPAQLSEGRIFDVPPWPDDCYSLKAWTKSDGSSAVIDVYCRKTYPSDLENGQDRILTEHIGRASFSGAFAQFQVVNTRVWIPPATQWLLPWAQWHYGLPGRMLSAVGQVNGDLLSPPGLEWANAQLVTLPLQPGQPGTEVLQFTSGPQLFVNGGPLLQAAPVPFAIVGPDQDAQFDPTVPFFYRDSDRSFYVLPTRYYKNGSVFTLEVPASPGSVSYEVKYEFRRFYHPFTRLFAEELEAGGVDNLFRRELQVSPQNLNPADAFSFPAAYQPVVDTVRWGSDTDDVDFSPDGAYSLYNWELFYHAPILLAERLGQNQRFASALRWFHFVFNPTRSGSETTAQRFWITKPFYELSDPAVQEQRIQQLLQLIDAHDAAAEAQVQRWRAHPFNPFLIADLRPVSYMKSVVMKYLDNLLAWGDNLFRTDSREALNQATLLYVLAAEILGPQPRRVDPPTPVEKTYADIAADLDAFGDEMVAIENALPATETATPTPIGSDPMPNLKTFLFKIPPNDKLLGYWTTVADRLFKLRHCMNIEGVVRSLALFDAPIDPGLLAAAVAAGADISSVLNDTGAPLPHYRFTVMQAKALEFCNEVKALGASLLAAIEKRDAEQLALLRSSKEVTLQTAVKAVRKSQLDEATQQIEVLNRGQAIAQNRHAYYTSRDFMNPWEVTALTLSGAATIAQGAALVADVLAGVTFLIPNFHLGASGFGGTPHVTAGEGGDNVGQSVERGANGLYQLAALADRLSAMAAVQGGYQRRHDDWGQAADQASLESDRISAEIAGATIRQTIAQYELDNQDTAITDAKDIDDFLHGKFTNAKLYDWMVGQLSTVYFQSYQLAFDLARRAERCFRYELGLTDGSFVSFGYWDSLRQGLLAAERLSYDLRRMDAAYLEQNRRRLELTKHVSLATVDPLALVQLINTGSCQVDLPEALFDYDYPGNYQRFIKSVGITIPAVVGPYSGVHCTLTLVKNTVRISPDPGDSYARKNAPAPDPRFVDQFGAVQSIATSSGQGDPGVFELNFRDERYLPFEGAGVISTWRLDMPKDTNNFDLATISDVILHVRYTALDGGDTLRALAAAAVLDVLPREGARLFSAKHDFADSWYRFLHPSDPSVDQQLVIDVGPDRFPFFARGRQVSIDKVEMFVVSNQAQPFVATLQPLLQGTATVNIPRDSRFGDLYHQVVTPGAPGSPGTWTIKLRLNNAADFRSLDESSVDDLLIAPHFKVS